MSMHDVELLRGACCVAGLDQQVTPAEMELLQKLADRAGVGAASLKAMIDMARTNEAFYKQQFKFKHPDPDRVLVELMRVAIADGDLSLDERVILGTFAERLGVPPARSAALIDEVLKRLSKGGSSPGTGADVRA